MASNPSDDAASRVDRPLGARYLRRDLMTPTPPTSGLRPELLFALVAAWPLSAAANSMSVIGQGPLIFIGPLVGLLAALVIGLPASRASRPGRPVGTVAAALALLALPLHGWLGFLTEVGGRFYLQARMDGVGQSLLAVALAITPVCAVGYSAGMCTRVVLRWVSTRRASADKDSRERG